MAQVPSFPQVPSDHLLVYFNLVMEKNEWDAVLKNRAALRDYVNVGEAVYYLRKQIENPLEGTNIDVQLESVEINEFRDHTTVRNLLEYLRRRVNGFSLLCSTLVDANQAFLAEALLETKEKIPEVDSAPSIDVPDSRRDILLKIAHKLQSKRSYINIHGEQGVGTSRFLEQAIKYLQEECYFSVKRIDLTDTPLILQQKCFTSMKYELNSEKSAMKKFYVFCVDNCSSNLLEQKPKHMAHQTTYIDNWIESCRNNLGISVLTTSSHPINGLENIEITRLPVHEMGRDIQKLFPSITDNEMEDLISTFPETCNPLDCFLRSTLYILNNRRADYIRRFLNKHITDTRNELFAAVFSKLSHVQQDLLLSVYSLPCNGKVTLSSIYCLYFGSSTPPEEHRIHMLELAIQDLVNLNLLQKNNEKYSMKDSNFFYHFRMFFKKRHPKRLRVFYLRGLHHYLDYTIKVIQDIHALCEFNQLQDKEWSDTIPRVSFVLDPSERSLEQAILKKPAISKALYNKRIFVTAKLRNIALRIPTSVLMLSAQNLLEDFDEYHHKYAEHEDKVKLLCLITELSLVPDCRTLANSRANLQRAFIEVEELIKKPTSPPELRVKYYLRLLPPLAEIYVREKNFEQAKKCYRECLKLKCDNKTINWELRKRLKYVDDMLKITSSDSYTQDPTGDTGAAIPLSPADQVTSNNSLSHDIKYHVEMGDTFYIRGDLNWAFTYYFELYRKFHSQHLHLKEQEYILMTMGHLKLQKHSRLIKSQVLDAIKFYEESQTFYNRRKDHQSEFLKIFIFTANLIAGHKKISREMMIKFRDGQRETQTAFFMVIMHRDTKHRLLWRELTYSEKGHQENRVKTQVVNYNILESVTYNIKRKEMKTTDTSKFLKFPSKKCLEYVESFNPSSLYEPETDQHLAVYIKIPSTRI